MLYFPCISVCNYSRPFSFGHLNRQFIMLLSGLGIPDDVFLQLQRDHFHRVRTMLHDEKAALAILEWRNQATEIADLQEANTGSSLDLQPRFAHLRPLQKRLIQEATKLKILVPESRTLYGVAETPRFSRGGKRLRGLLRPGECLVRLSMNGRKPKSLQNQSVNARQSSKTLKNDV